jgi:hypothetical protein
MAGNVIYRGPAERQPRSVSKPVAGAYLPGTLVEETATQLSQITTAIDKRPLVLINSDFLGQDLVTAYASGDTGIAFEPMVGDRLQCAMAAATYTLNQPLTIAASGRLAAAATTNPIVAYFVDTPGAISAGALCDVVWANSSAKA